MTDAEVQAALEAAVEKMIEAEQDLFVLNIGEPAIAHHLSKYLEQSISDELDVDVEYNKHGTEKKVLLLPPANALDQPPQFTVVRPDIVVHSRGNDVENLLVVEVKKPGQKLGRNRQKLQAFRDQYRYRNAAHVVLGYHKGEFVSQVIWVEG